GLLALAEDRDPLRPVRHGPHRAGGVEEALGAEHGAQLRVAAEDRCRLLPEAARPEDGELAEQALFVPLDLPVLLQIVAVPLIALSCAPAQSSALPSWSPLRIRPWAGAAAYRAARCWSGTSRSLNHASLSRSTGSTSRSWLSSYHTLRCRTSARTRWTASNC